MAHKVTYDEFCKAVMKYFHTGWPQLSDIEVERFMEEQKEYISGRFDLFSAEYEKGEITYAQFLRGGSESVGYCLMLLYGW